MPPRSAAEPQPRVAWQSVRWPDNSTYEGLVKEDKCHVRGVFKYSNGDRYEGEFEDNNMSGYGMYVWGQEGSVYRGQWSNSMMHGCGAKITKQPNGSFLAEEGQFVNDEWVGDVMACTVEQARSAAAEADTAAQMARVFEQMGDEGGASSSAAAKVREEAVAAAEAAAQQGKGRRHQRQRQQQRSTAPATAPGLEAASSVTPAAATAPTARQQQQGPLGLVQQAVARLLGGARRSREQRQDTAAA